MKGTPRSQRPPMSDELLAARRIYNALMTDRSFTLAKARIAYRKAFGISYDDKQIGAAYRDLVNRHFGSARLLTWSPEDIPVPARIALALYLREDMGRKQGKQKGSAAVSLEDKFLMEEAQRLKKHYRTKEHCKADE